MEILFDNNNIFLPPIYTNTVNNIAKTEIIVKKNNNYIEDENLKIIIASIGEKIKENKLKIEKKKNRVYNKLFYKANTNKNIKIFGNEFIKRNKKKLKVIRNNKYEKTILKTNNIKSNRNISIKFNFLENIIYMNSMFKECTSLYKLSGLPKWKIDYVKDISFLFYGCASLTSLPEISKWNTSQVY